MVDNINGLAVIVQCRLSSTRLPSKALKRIGSKTIFERTLLSMKRVKAQYYYVATDEASYEALLEPCKNLGYELFVGPLEDVLERFCLLIRKINCKTVLRATADNPYLFSEAASMLYEEYLKNEDADYVTYKGLPHGSGVEIFNAVSLLNARDKTEDPYDHEHVGPSLYNHKEFNCLFLDAPEAFFYPDLRTTVDTKEDYSRALKAYEYMISKYEEEDPYNCDKIIEAYSKIQNKKNILFYPSVASSKGTGHLQRCLKLCSELNAYIYIPDSSTLKEKDFLVNKYLEEGLEDFQIVKAYPVKEEYSLIVLDLFDSSSYDVKKLSTLAPILSLDDASALSSSYVDYELNSIPSLSSKLVNKSDYSYLPSPVHRRESLPSIENIKKVLITFGGEESSLTNICLKYLKASPYEITVTGKVNQELLDHKITHVPYINNLKEELYKYDLVITHYGFTLYEARKANCFVLLVNPTSLHEALSNKYGFNTVSPKVLTSFNLHKFRSYLVNYKEDSIEPSSLKDFIEEVNMGERLSCPLCKGTEGTIVERNIRKTYRKCNCSMVYLSWKNSQGGREYKSSYFAEEYKNQYGKTYLEDFDSIKNQGLRRISIIHKYLPSGSILDIGCAFGPFLQAALEKGYTPYGTDISEDCVNYVQDVLNIRAKVSSFPDFDSTSINEGELFNVVTMWYVIEHFRDLDSVLNKVSSLVAKGGLFCFGTPYGQGVSGRYNKHNFYIDSPMDHYTVWNKLSAKKILNKYGFRVLKFVNTGHHPERFSFIKKHNISKTNLIYKFFMLYSRIFFLGDTFEVYCTKL